MTESTSVSMLKWSCFLVGTGVFMYLTYSRKKQKEILWRKRVQFKKISHNSDVGRCFGADIGGTLAKLVYFEQTKNTDFMRKPRSLSHSVAANELRSFLIGRDSYGGTGIRDSSLSVEVESLGGTLHFIRFETRKMESAIDMISNYGFNQSVRVLCCTGGGAHKYADMFEKLAGIQLKKYDELDSTIKGLSFLLKLLPEELYTFENVDFRTLKAKRVHRPRQNKDGDIFPYLLVSLGSGVSILHVKSELDYERVSGSSVGGGTYWGLCRLLTKCKTFDEALDASENGDNFLVDMSVGDIYGGSYDRFNLPAKTVASSFGKMITKETTEKSASDADVARALLIMITQNIGQIAYLNAQLCNTKRIFFVGNFLRHNKISCRTLAYAINYWSKGEVEAQFCKHEGYLGAMGAFLHNAEFRRQSLDQD